MEQYTKLLGWGPWNVYRHEPPRLHDTVVRGEQVDYTMLGAETHVGDMGFELLQPLEGPSIYREWLDEHGEGLHHVAVMLHDFDESTLLKQQLRRGRVACPDGRADRRDDRVLLPRHRAVAEDHPRVRQRSRDRPGARLRVSVVSGRRVAIVTGGGTGIGPRSQRRLAAGTGSRSCSSGRRPEPLEEVRSELGGRKTLDDRRPTSATRAPGADRRGRARRPRADRRRRQQRGGDQKPARLTRSTGRQFDQHYAVNVARTVVLGRRGAPGAAIVRRRRGCQHQLVGRVDRQARQLALRLDQGSARIPNSRVGYELAADGSGSTRGAGPVDTPIHATYSDDLAATYADLARRIPLGRMGHVDDIAAWVSFLVGPSRAGARAT